MRKSVKEETEVKAETTSDDGGDGGGAADAGTAVQHLAQPSVSCPYQVGEKVIATHEHFFYEAKVEKVELREGWMFYIHYWRWKRSWDEWVGVDRLKKFTKENLQLVTDVKAGTAGSLSPTKLGTSSVPLVSYSRWKKHKNDSASRCRKRKIEHTLVKGRHNKPVEKLINISVPPTLKKQLMDDFEFIKRTGKLVKLPRKPNADEIIKKYQEYRRKKDVVTSTSLGEVLSGLCAYFNKALPVMLLYNNERQQYQEAIYENTSPSSVYGAEHLLRLFVKLPALLYDLNIDEDSLQDLQKNLHDFLKFLQKNQHVFFQSTYYGPELSRRSTDKEYN
ncbi:protein MRG1 isoform X1 [Beta vulgaris subsp. vulgaris]|uniref:protein MRG1 isoform X1 n=1 Tax=Beta vulgaris subsp. vulgaris TaxID=3555 RepID=UPI002036750B|nr:protein MRG1 isoform X1 [Beta vulgaris subsp. vulgaris]